MSMFKRFVEERKLIRISVDRKLVLKEIEGATIQGYYSMFHAARALLYSKGFREKSHYALLVALRELFKNQLESELIENFEEAISLREEADYDLIFSEEGATSIVNNADKFLNKIKEFCTFDLEIKS
ncbi:MAG: HEPN domain-containing protein [Candidatus Bathyarchaeia archaeon]|nr:HEPN domain-containing protein [Candidatus Bathyarchaeia archaeon]